MSQHLIMNGLAWSLYTGVVYVGCTWLYRRSGHRLLALPILIGTALVVLALALCQTDYDVYAQATRGLRWLMGPAIIALAVPLYHQMPLLRRLALPVLIALIAGSLAAILSGWGLARLLGMPDALALSLAPKSATMPIAILSAQQAGGLPALAALAVVATGVLGTFLTGPVLRWLRMDSPPVRSFTYGLVAHAIGTARAVQEVPSASAFAALAMGLNGLTTALLMTMILR